MPVSGPLFFLCLIFIPLLTILLALFLFLGPGKKRPDNRWLGLLASLIGLKAINILINGIILGNNFYLYNFALDFLLAPLPLLYTRSLLGAPFRPEREWFHFLPFVIFGLIGLAPGQLVLIRESLWELAPLLYTGAYLGAALVFITKRLPILKEIRSNIPDGQVRILTLVLSVWAIKIALGGASLLLNFSGQAELSVWLYAASLAMEALIVLCVVPLTLKREEPVKAVSRDEETLAAQIVQREPADADIIRKNAGLFKQLDVILQQEKLYLDPGLTLPQFSKLADSTPKQVSRAINSVGGQSFFDYINGYRVFTAQELLADKDKSLNLREVMYAAGFHSKHTFETAFRKVSGMTPGQFTRKNR
ncbi:MAG: helix-turn-helix transcriptional regulator [Lewinellaceae bacterium]|nr:helix-turn-helix transcriptional regulator [Lewinellaceae bacterium]MCB9289061.1 helix-turn-helix transcriptional regulator [Lewinellaceae bacterium]